MAEIHPFRGVRYNQKKVTDLSSVICYPYDVITPQLQQDFYHRNQYNFVRLEHGRELPQDTTRDNKYTRSAATVAQWLEQCILKADETPTIYLHDHYFSHHGKTYKRRGITACVRLEKWDKMVIRPHEGTLAEPREDRVNMLRELKVNTSPILTLYQDQEQRISSLLTTEVTENKPLICFTDAGGEKHCLWTITNPQVLNRICDNLADQPLYIADGHHRYESALAYQREQQTGSPDNSVNEDFNFVMMTLVDFSDPGLVILPMHRLVRGVSKSILSVLESKLNTFFKIDELPLENPDVWQKVDGFLRKTDKTRMVLFGLNGTLLSLELCDFDAASKLMPYFHPESYQRLGVTIANHIILENLLSLGNVADETKISYTDDLQDAVNRVKEEEYQMALLLRSVGAETIKTIADAGDRLPKKSTYFYPKLPAGLVFHRLV
ncbi:DUF1015 domain-containing protein [Chloroflexota bacterium]